VPAILDVEGTGVAPVGSVGMQYQLTDKATIGVTYTEQSNFWLHGATNGSLIVGPGVSIDSRFNSKLQISWPRSVAAGIKYDLCEHRRLGVDVIWYDWSQAFSQIDLWLYAPTNPFVPNHIKQVLPLNWSDTVSLRLGYEEQFTPLDTIRCGYVYHASPSPNSTLNPYLDGILEHSFSLGYSRWLHRASLNLAYQYCFGPTRNVDNSALIGGQFNDSSLNAQAHFAMISFLFPF
jgi:long-subunit fatty acid transport protein